MDWVLLTLLFLHVGGAVVGFGPTFAFLILGPMAGREPQHVNFALRFQRRVANLLVVPLALFQGVTGLLLIWRIGFGILSSGWLLAGIALYVLALANSFGVLLPTLNRLLAATSGPPPAAPTTLAGAPDGPKRPPPHIAALVRRGRLAGMTNALLIVVIVFLMVTKPF